MDICYIYCTEVPESKSQFYSLPVVRVAKMFNMDEDVTVHVAAVGELDTTLLENQNADCHVIDRRLPRLGILSFYFQLFYLSIIMAHREDVDVFSNIWAHYNLFPVMVVARLLNATVLARVFGLGNPWDRSLGEVSLRMPEDKSRRLIATVRVLNWFEVSLLNAVQGVYTNADVVREELLDQGVAAQRISILSQGVDTTYFTPGEPSDPVLTDGSLTVLWVGRVSAPAKRLDLACKTIDRVSATIPEVQLAVAGGGEPPRAAREAIHSDIVTRLRDAYRAANLLLVTSELEGIPNVVLEAQSCGLPVVSTEVGDVPKILWAGGGVITEAWDNQALAKNVVELLMNEQRAETMGARGREYIEMRHSLDSLREPYRELFKSGTVSLDEGWPR